MKHAVSLAIVLFGVWLLWSGHYNPRLVGLGIVSCLAVVLIVRRMDVVDDEGTPIRGLHRYPGYLLWLAWQIAKANVDVARRVLHPRLPIRPRLIRVRAGQRRDLGRVVYANSITLMPGTVSVDVVGAQITVHALTSEAAEDVQGGEMDRRVTKLEGLG